MDSATRDKILKWIADNHDHHAYEDVERQDGSGTFDEIFVDCVDANLPYVNSLDLERFIKDL